MKETTRKRLSYALSTEQYRALEGMAYWNAELHFAVEKNDEENYLQRCRKNINFCFDDCDKRRIPFWVQNIALVWSENPRNWISEYLTEHLKLNGVTIENPINSIAYNC